MKIYQQESNNDCGIAVTQSLINHFYNLEVSKEELYSKTNLTEDGLSILDLELLNKEYGISLESYELNIEEFEKYETKDYFILLLKENNFYHYTIAKKHRKSVTLFDSQKGKNTLKCSDLKETFGNVLITIKLTRKLTLNPEKIAKGKDKTHYEIAFKNLVVDIIIFSINVAVAFLSKNSLNLILNNQLFNQIARILLVTFLGYVTLEVGEYIKQTNIFSEKQRYLKALFKEAINALTSKKNIFFSKLEKNQFLLLKTHIENIANYHSEYVNKWIISLVSVTSLTLLLLSFHLGYLIIITVTLVNELLFGLYMKKVYEKNLYRLLETQNEVKRTNFELENFLKFEVNRGKLLQICKTFKDQFFGETLINQTIRQKNSWASRINSLVNNLTQISLYLLTGFWCASNNINLEHFMVINFAYSHVSKSFKNILDFYFLKLQYSKSAQIYKNILNVDIAKDKETPISLPKNIKIKDLTIYRGEKALFKNLNLSIKPSTFIYGSSGIGKSTLYKLISNKIAAPEGEIIFDDQPISELNNCLSFSNLVILQNNNSYLTKENFLSHINKVHPKNRKKILRICRNMNLNLQNISSQEISSGQKQFLNLINLLNHENKIILLDESTAHIDSRNQEDVFRYLIPEISAKNFVICSEHRKYLKKYFDNQINLNG